jgi:putative heme-binding domain-containing protein
LSDTGLGPDLASKRDGVSDVFLVESVLAPSLSLRTGFELVVVKTDIGLILTGYHVREDDEILVLREPAGGKEIEVYKEDIEASRMSKISAMPAGLVNQLTSRAEFLDLARFLMEVNEHGSARQAELKGQVDSK